MATHYTPERDLSTRSKTLSIGEFFKKTKFKALGGLAVLGAVTVSLYSNTNIGIDMSPSTPTHPSVVQPEDGYTTLVVRDLKAQGIDPNQFNLSALASDIRAFNEKLNPDLHTLDPGEVVMLPNEYE